MNHDWRDARVFFASDLHAGDGGPADDFARHAPLFDEFLRRLLPTRHRLALAGDVEENWQFGPVPIARTYGAIGRALGRLVEEGRLVYNPGNHDEEAAGFPILAGLRWTAPAVTIETAAGRIWVEHGHRFDPWNRDPGWQHRLLLAAAKVAERIYPDADVLDGHRAPSDRRGPDRDARMLEGARSILVGSGLAGVVMGHTHRGGQWKVETPAGPRSYVNCGAWVSSVTPGVGIADEGGIRYLQVNPAAPPWAALFG